MQKAGYDKEAQEIDKYLRENNISVIAKADIRARYGFSNVKAPAIFAALKKYGWYAVTWSLLKRDD